MVLSKLIRMIPVKNAEHLKSALFRYGIFQRKQLFSYSVMQPAWCLPIKTTYQQKAQPCLMQKRFYTDSESDDRNKFNLNLDKRRQRLTENIAQKRIKVQEHKQHLIQGIRDKKTKVQNKVRQIEEIVERENILTIPNVLCIGRSILAPYIGYVIVQGDYNLAIGLLALAGITDFLDGFIARTWTSQASKLGSFLDPMADKLLVGSLVISLSYCNLFPIWLSGMIIFRDVFLIIAGFIIRYISLPPPRTLIRYFDATHVTAKLQPTLISKLNTVVQLVAIGASLASPMCTGIEPPLLTSLWYFTGFTTAAAAASYIFSKNTYQLIKNRKIFGEGSPMLPTARQINNGPELVIPTAIRRIYKSYRFNRFLANVM